jgi:hypothetical protein
VAKQEVLGGDDGARGKESHEGSDYVAKEVEHRAILDPLPLQVQPRRARASIGLRAQFLRRTTAGAARTSALPLSAVDAP